MLNLSESFRLMLLDVGKGLNSRYYYRLFTQSFQWKEDEILVYQNNKLKELIQHAYKNIPYYTKLLDNYDIKPDDIQSKEDLIKLPVLNRVDIVDNYTDIIDNKNQYGQLFRSSSSGTTGTPIKYIHDQKGESAGIAGGYALYNLSGWNVGAKTLHIWGNPESIKKWSTISSKFKRQVLGRKNYPAFLLNDPLNYLELLNIIRQFKPHYIDGYSSSISSFAHWLAAKKQEIEGVKTVFTTAENLSDSNRELIEKQIGPVSDLYGCGEINGIAIQPVNNNRYYVLDPHVIVETIDNNGLNELIVTDLNNHIMPFIRYKTGDTIDDLLPANNDSKLPFTSFSKLEGRLTEFIKLPSGKVIHPISIMGGTFLRAFPQIRKHKVIWDGAALNFEVECSTEINLENLTSEIRQNFEKYEVAINIEIKDRILPGKSGKFSYIEIRKGP